MLALFSNAYASYWHNDDIIIYPNSGASLTSLGFVDNQNDPEEI